MLRRLLRALSSFALLGAGCDAATAPRGELGAPDLGPSPDLAFVSNCTIAATVDEARRAAGHIDAASAILPGGRKLTPTGTLLDLGGYPIAIRVLPGDRYAVVSDDAVHDEALRLVDLAAADPLHPVVSSIPYPYPGGGTKVNGMFYGMALAKDGKRIYIANGGYDPAPGATLDMHHYNQIEAYDLVGLVGTPPSLVRNDALTIKLYFRPANATFAQRVPAGMVLSGDEKTLYVACQGDNTPGGGELAIVDLTPGNGYGAEIGTAVLPGLDPYDVALDETSHTAFVSLWGGAQKGSSVVDGVVPVDVSNPRAPVAAADPISTGKSAEAELFLAGKIYVTNTDADTLSVIDAASKMVRTMPVTTSMILGASPNNLAVDPGDMTRTGRIYIANANENAVVALDLQTYAIVGQIPTAWYPTAVAVRADGSLVIAAARGLGAGPSDGNSDNERSAGVLQLIARPSDDELKAGTKTVFDNLDRQHQLEPKFSCPDVTRIEDSRFPLPIAPGGKSPIKYVFLIIRENKTYDSVFGDLGIGNGDPTLTEWTPDMIPNARDLAKRFVLLDNFYSHAELSIQGHEWTTGCIANDYVEKGWGATDDYGRGYRPNGALSATTSGRLGYPGTDSIFVHLDKAGIAYHNYGEVTNLQGAKNVFDPGYPGLFFRTDILDVVKERYVVDTILGLGDQLEPFSYILLPNDHTGGTKDGASTPASMMADNDEATGRFVDEISHSPIWGQSLIAVMEDDPGGGGDHVEQHRSILLLASPWIKRGYISSTNFDIASLYHSIELLIGAKPMNVYDGHAAGLYELFSATPDMTPYTFIPRIIPIKKNSADDPMVEECNKMDFSAPDRADLTRVLWKVTHGKNAEPPWLHGRKTSPAFLDRDGD